MNSIAFEIVTEFGRAHDGLLASNLGKKASINLGAIHFLSAFGLQTLRDLPDMEALEDAGLISGHAVQTELASLGLNDDDEVAE